MEYRFLQYPRGLNKGGVLDTDVCPTISCSSWQNNCFLIEICTSEQEMPWWTLHLFVGGDVQGSIRESWILRHSIQHHYKSWQFTSLRNNRRMDKVKNNRGGESHRSMEFAPSTPRCQPRGHLPDNWHYRLFAPKNSNRIWRQRILSN